MTRILGFVALLGAIGVILGAFGAHYLAEHLEVEAFESFKTGVRYHLLHVLLLLVVLTNQRLSLKTKRLIGSLVIIGIILFSGSIYAITIGIPASDIWYLTPVGGVCLILAWIFLALAFFRMPKR
jgi:uncharacterized membrane protein YgdD (TMEM256/DUF423 family)